MSEVISFVSTTNLCGDGIRPITMDYFRGQQYPWLSILLPKLTQAKIAWEVLSWKDPNIAWQEKTTLIFGPVWGYFEEHRAFSMWVQRLQKHSVVLHNASDFVLWNLNKTYLKELGEAGIPIPVSQFIDQHDTRSWQCVASEFLRKMEGKSCIIKGIVDAAASSFIKVQGGNIAACEQHFEQSKRRHQGVILQEYLPEINLCGELSFVFFDGQLGHVFIKTPAAGEDRVQSFFGGKSFHIKDQNYQQCLDEITQNFRPDFQLGPQQIELAQHQAINYIAKLRQRLKTKKIPFPLYLRLDAVMRNQTLVLMELEGIEPYMELAEALKNNPQCKTLDLYVAAIIRAQRAGQQRANMQRGLKEELEATI